MNRYFRCSFRCQNQPNLRKHTHFLEWRLFERWIQIHTKYYSQDKHCHYSNKKSTFLIVLYPLNESSETIKTYGPTTIKLALDDEKIANGAINFIKKNLTESPPNFDKISKSKFSSYIVDE